MKSCYNILGFLLCVSWLVQPVAAQERALLWAIQGKGLEAPSYVYGTIHLIGKADFFMTDATREAFGSAQQVAFEIDMEEMSDFTKLMPLLMQSFMKGDTTLPDLLSKADYLEVKTHFEGMGLPMFMLNRIKPLFLSALDPTMMGTSGGTQEEMMSYEMEFMKMAQEAKKPTAGLETAAYQMRIFDSIPYRNQAEMLMSAIRNTDQEADDSFGDLVELYKSQDIEAMQEGVAADSGMANFQDILLTNRNRNWIPVMERMMAAKPTFFAVGAGHLGGKNGVINLLQGAGYTLTPIK